MTHELPILTVTKPSLWEDWLDDHQNDRGVWLKIAKKDSGLPTVTYDEALEIALCWGWIDGQKSKGLDETYFLQKFTPRRPRSTWSKRNVEKIAKLTAAGKMKPAGLIEVEKAKADGRWAAAYDSPKDMVIPEDFLRAVNKNPKAKAFFETLSKANTFSIAFRLTMAKKPETRQRRFEKLLAMLERGEKLH